jgi:putative oxidoreductase
MSVLPPDGGTGPPVSSLEISIANSAVAVNLMGRNCFHSPSHLEMFVILRDGPQLAKCGHTTMGGHAMIEQLQTVWAPRVLSLLRIVSALIYMEHGTQKLLNFPARPNNAAGPELFSLYGFAGSLEIVGGILLVFGLFTRPVAFILSGEMAFAYWMSHAPRNFFPLLNGGDSPILYCFLFLYLAVAGGGAFSLDALMRKK